MRHIKMVVILLLYVMHFFFVCIPLFLMIIIGLEIVYALKYIYERIAVTDKNSQTA
jgi:hypothetical protein